MKYQTMLRLQKCLYLNVYLTFTWSIVIMACLYTKINLLGHLTKYLSVTIFSLLIIIETTRLYLGHYGNLSCRVPELAGFLMLTVLMQMPLVSLLLFNPYFLNCPTEVVFHTLLYIITIAEVGFGYSALKQSSAYAKSIYLSSERNSK